MAGLDESTMAYLEAALWSTNDESDDNGGEPMDKNYDAEESTIQPTLPPAVEVLREVLDHFRAADFLPDELLATALMVAYGGAS